MKTKMIAYVRVSTQDQSGKGESIQSQIERVKAYATIYDIELVETVTEVKSAKSLSNRTELMRALAMLESGVADGILVTKLDRLTRNVGDLGSLIEKYFNRFALLSVNEHIDTRTAAGRLNLNILTSVSQWEREATCERTKEIKQHQKKQGKYLGGPVPYGYLARDGYLVKNTQEQKTIEQARKLRDSGMSLLAVARLLSSKGLRSRKGTMFQSQQVKRLVTGG